MSVTNQVSLIPTPVVPTISSDNLKAMVQLYAAYQPFIAQLAKEEADLEFYERNRRILQRNLDTHLEEYGWSMTMPPTWDRAVGRCNEAIAATKAAMAEHVNRFMVAVANEAIIRRMAGQTYVNYGDIIALCAHLAPMAHLL